MDFINFADLEKHLKIIQEDICDLMEESGGELHNIIIDNKPKDDNGQFILSQYCRVVKCLEEAYDILSYLERPIRWEGFLHLNNRGKYELDGHVFSCGSFIEVYIYDEDVERYKWIKSRMEARSGGEYYIVGYPGSPMEVKVRARGYW